jgi:SAM-dependent methyltransferase
MNGSPEPDPATDRARLVGAAYGTPEPLMARVALYDYQTEPFDLVAWVLDTIDVQHPLSQRSRVVDVGCGPGRYLAAVGARHPGISAVGLDLSPGMTAATLGAGTPAAVADAMHLPIRTAACDVAIAAHMLYHVPDIALAATELARIAGASGIVAIVTNGRHHLRELDEIAERACIAVTGSPWPAPRSAARFLLDDAAALVAPALTVVGVERISKEILLPDPAPLVAYVESEESLFDPALPDGVAWTDVLLEVEAQARTIIERDGAFVVHSDVGVLLCRAR